MDREDTCHRTCFSLQLDGNVLDNFAELKSIEGLQEGSLLKVVEGQILFFKSHSDLSFSRGAKREAEICCCLQRWSWYHITYIVLAWCVEHFLLKVYTKLQTVTFNLLHTETTAKMTKHLVLHFT